MFRILCVCLLLTVAVSAHAAINPDRGRMSIYFDEAATIYEHTTAPYVMVSAYVVLTDPAFDALEAYEFGYEITGNFFVANQYLRGPKPQYDITTVGNVRHRLGEPYETTEATVLAEVEIFVLDSSPILFTLRGAEEGTIPSWPGPVVWIDGKAAEILLSAWNHNTDEPAVCAVINGGYPQPTISARWGEVKSLYR